ncbi:MAG TPA: DUF4956 domain-containing protein [Chloroflexi bacterium]|nr:DUF4956 domain-containing protein [Chloroflexota bacterium]|tara:strand:+ start:2657 stop:3334 length:678 start_codon:yes stop_codon:yes gene_type:complete
MNITGLDVSPISLPLLLLNLALGVLVSTAIAWYYVRFGRALSNRNKFAPILPVLTLITLLVITVVKSSLALSLGLVGALSIVRFRTAIKDPEDLIYLFFAISIGLGLGADQRVPTIVASAVIFLFLIIRERFHLVQSKSHNLYLNIETSTTDAADDLFSDTNQLLTQHLTSLDLQRLDTREGIMQLSYHISVDDPERLVSIMDVLNKRLPNSSITIVDQSNVLGR